MRQAGRDIVHGDYPYVYAQPDIDRRKLVRDVFHDLDSDLSASVRDKLYLSYDRSGQDP